MAPYTIGSTAYVIAIVFHALAAIFPRLARKRRRIRELKELHDQGEATVDVYGQAEALERAESTAFV